MSAAMDWLRKKFSCCCCISDTTVQTIEKPAPRRDEGRRRRTDRAAKRWAQEASSYHARTSETRHPRSASKGGKVADRERTQRAVLKRGARSTNLGFVGGGGGSHLDATRTRRGALKSTSGTKEALPRGVALPKGGVYHMPQEYKPSARPRSRPSTVSWDLVHLQQAGGGKKEVGSLLGAVEKDEAVTAAAVLKPEARASMDEAWRSIVVCNTKYERPLAREVLGYCIDNDIVRELPVLKREVGSVGVVRVFKANHKGRWYVVKNYSTGMKGSVHDKAKREWVVAQRGLTHPNLVTYCFAGDRLVHHSEGASKQKILVMEAVPGENSFKERAKLFACEDDTLDDLCPASVTTDEEVEAWKKAEVQRRVDNLRVLAKGMLDGLLYLKNHNLVHRGICPENVILRPGGAAGIPFSPVLGGFGFTESLVDSTAPLEEHLVAGGGGMASEMRERRRSLTILGAPGMVAPEIVHAKGSEAFYTSKTDLWSLGAMLHQLCINRPPSIRSLEAMSLAVADGTSVASDASEDQPVVLDFDYHTDTDHLGRNFVDFVQKLVAYDPDKRLSVEDALKHPFITGAGSR